jgi:hypothetical protein
MKPIRLPTVAAIQLTHSGVGIARTRTDVGTPLGRDRASSAGRVAAIKREATFESGEPARHARTGLVAVERNPPRRCQVKISRECRLSMT